MVGALPALVFAALLAACSAVSPPSTLSRSGPAAGPGYVVQRGESLTGIATRTGVNAWELARINGLRPPYTIHAGQSLRLPQGARTRLTESTARPLTSKQTPTPAPVPSAKPAARPVTQPAVQPPVVRQDDTPPLAAPTPQRIGPPVLSWPADAPVVGSFGTVSGGRPSDGVDMLVLPGQRILSAASGTVLFAGLEPMFGQLIIVDHGGGWMTAYGFVGQITVKEGDPVKYRERIGVNGTKNRTLHFQLRRDNEPRDPLPYLPARL